MQICLTTPEIAMDGWQKKTSWLVNLTWTRIKHPSLINIEYLLINHIYIIIYIYRDVMCSYQNHEIASEINGFYLFLSCCSLSPRHLHFRLSKVELEDFMDRSQKWGGQFGGFPRHGGTPKSSKLWTIWVLKPMVTWGFHEIPHFKSHWAMTIGVGFSVDLEVCLKKIPMIHWNGWGMVIIRMGITLQMMSLMAMINYRYHWGHPKNSGVFHLGVKWLGYF